MTQRQLNIIQAIEDGLKDARQELDADDTQAYYNWQKALAEICDNTPRQLGLRDAAYYAAMLLHWADLGRPAIVDLSSP